MQDLQQASQKRCSVVGELLARSTGNGACPRAKIQDLVVDVAAGIVKEAAAGADLGPARAGRSGWRGWPGRRGPSADGGNADGLGCVAEAPIERGERETAADGDFQVSGVVHGQAMPAGDFE